MSLAQADIPRAFRHPPLVMAMATGVVLLFFFGGLLLGVLPGQPGVSWQGHLFGAIGGGLAAAWVSARPRRRRYDAFT